MASDNFRFKRFTVWHDQCAMKVGTDGVLLGAWCPLPQRLATAAPIRLLDIGTGSGLIALMLAQRLETTDRVIDAIDIDPDAAAQATKNFALSPWKDALHAHPSTLQDWQAEPYDLIVSNPPYFQNSLKNPDNQRATARHTDSLSYAELITHALRLLAPHGTLALVLPIDAEAEILHLATDNNLFPTHITHVHTKPGKPAKRLLITLTSSPHHLSGVPDDACIMGCSFTSSFHIESDNAPRSEEYIALTKDFYL